MILKEVLNFIKSSDCGLPKHSKYIARRVIKFYGIEADVNNVSFAEILSGSEVKPLTILQYRSVWLSVLKQHSARPVLPVKTLTIPIPLIGRKDLVQVEIPQDFNHEDAERVEKILMAYAI